MGFTKKGFRAWTPSEDSSLRGQYASMGEAAIPVVAKMFARTENAVKIRAVKLGLRKPDGSEHYKRHFSASKEGEDATVAFTTEAQEALGEAEPDLVEEIIGSIPAEPEITKEWMVAQLTKLVEAVQKDVDGHPPYQTTWYRASDLLDAVRDILSGDGWSVLEYGDPDAEEATEDKLPPDPSLICAVCTVNGSGGYVTFTTREDRDTHLQSTHPYCFSCNTVFSTQAVLCAHKCESEDEADGEYCDELDSIVATAMKGGD
jgi:hypothetical protein